LGGLAGWGIYTASIGLYARVLVDDESARLFVLELFKNPFLGAFEDVLAGQTWTVLWLATSIALPVWGVVVGLRWPLSNRTSCGAPLQWPGGVQQSERDAAAEKLAACVLKIENEQRPYHLVGHSHGGSIIWKALQLASSRKPGIDDGEEQMSKLRNTKAVHEPSALLKLVFRPSGPPPSSLRQSLRPVRFP
jgi:hypothetical protein